MKSFAALNPDDTERENSSSGGIFSIIAKKIIEEGGVIYGAAFEKDWNVVHKRIDSLEGIAELQGSKYVFPAAKDIYQDAIRDLNDGRTVLFTGTPCQIAAMSKLAGINDHLLLVEVICHGAPMPRYWNRFLDEICKQQHRDRSCIKEIKFRDKSTGWRGYSFSILFNDGLLYKKVNDKCLYLKAFIKGYTLKEGCFKCPFKYPDGSKADITLGDFWGVEHILPSIDDNKGISEIICRTDKGEKFIRDLGMNLIPVDFETLAKYNKSLATKAKKPQDYNYFQDYESKHSFLKSANKFAGDPLNLKIKKSIASAIINLQKHLTSSSRK